MNTTNVIKVGGVSIGGNRPFVLIAGPCVIESKAGAMAIAVKLKRITEKLGVPFVFKASYDKANRTSIDSFRGPGIVEGLKTLNEIKTKLKVPVLSDVHSVEEIDQAAEVLDIMQIPAFLCRQTDLVVKAAKSGRVVNVKKGQFLAPWDMKSVVKKIEHSGSKKIMLTERGASFGYNTLVTDFRSLDVLSQFGYPVIFDATHSVQQPGGRGDTTGGERKYIPLLSRCAVAAGCDGLFMETHPDPDKALSDGPNMVPLNLMEGLLKELIAIDRIVKGKKK